MLDAKKAVDYYHGLLKRLKNVKLEVQDWIYANLFEDAELDDSLRFCSDLAFAKDFSITWVAMAITRTIYQFESWFNAKFSKKN